MALCRKLRKKAPIVFNLHPFYGSGYRKTTDFAKNTSRIPCLAYRTSSLFKPSRRRRRSEEMTRSDRKIQRRKGARKNKEG